MTPIEKPDLLQRLINEPHDYAALSDLYATMGEDPEQYARFLELAAQECADRTASSHYLTEAGRTYLETLKDVPEGCRLLGRAVDLDPLNERAADLLAGAVASELKGADYGGLLKRRAEVLDRLSRHDRSLTLRAVEAWERYADNVLRCGASPTDAVAAMSRALDLMRGTMTRSSRPPPTRREAPETLEPPPRSTPRGLTRDTIQTPKPQSAMLPGAGPRSRDMDSAPTRPRGTLPPESLPTDATALADGTIVAPTIRSPRPAADTPPEGEAAGDGRPDRLIALFESLRGVDTCTTVESAARFLLDIARSAVGARYALIHALDAANDEYVVVAVSGAIDRALVGTRTPTSDPLLGDAIGGARAVIADSESHRVLEGDRWSNGSPKRCVLCAPALLDELPLGALELIDPLDRGRFERDDEHVAVYVAERWAEILSDHGQLY